jgi:hypothetical protein
VSCSEPDPDRRQALPGLKFPSPIPIASQGTPPPGPPATCEVSEMFVRSLGWLALCLAGVGRLHAQAAPLHELSTDRPDRTESPYTVDRGRVQVEMDFANGPRLT